MESAASSLGNRAETVEQASFLATSHANLPVLGLDSRRENSARGAPVVGGTAPLRLAQVSPSGPPSTPVVVSVNCPRAAEPAQPSYWPLWVALGLVVAAGVVVGVMYARENADLAMPITTFGAKRF